MAIKMLSVDIDDNLNHTVCWNERDTLFHSSNKYINWFNEKGKHCRYNLDAKVDVFHSKSHRSIYAVRMKNSKLKFTLTHNSTNQSYWKPITPWIAAHRLWHAAVHFYLQLSRCELTQKYFDEMSLQRFNNYSNHYREESVSEILTMKSARRKQLFLNLDIEAEMFAQWFITGSVKFKKYQHLESKVNQMFEQMFEEEINGYHWVW